MKKTSRKFSYNQKLVQYETAEKADPPVECPKSNHMSNPKSKHAGSVKDIQRYKCNIKKIYPMNSDLQYNRDYVWE